MSEISDEVQNLAQALNTYTNSIASRMVGEFRVQIPDQLSVPYKTNMYVGNRQVMAVKVSLGALPNGTTKVTPLPTAVTDVWDRSTAYLDISNCYARNRTNENVVPLPHSTVSDFFRDDNGIQIALTNGEVYIRSQLDSSIYDGFATVLYLEATTQV